MHPICALPAMPQAGPWMWCRAARPVWMYTPPLWARRCDVVAHSAPSLHAHSSPWILPTAPPERCPLLGLLLRHLLTSRRCLRSTKHVRHSVQPPLTCAISTMRTMSAITVCCPLCSARTCTTPSQLTVPAVTLSPAHHSGAHSTAQRAGQNLYPAHLSAWPRLQITYHLPG